MSAKMKWATSVALFLAVWLGSMLGYAAYRGENWSAQIFQGSFDFCRTARSPHLAAGWSFDYDLPLRWSGFRPSWQWEPHCLMRIPTILLLGAIALLVLVGKWIGRRITLGQVAKEKGMKAKLVFKGLLIGAPVLALVVTASLFFREREARAAALLNYEGVPLKFRVAEIVSAGVDPVDGLPLTDFVIRSQRFAITITHNTTLLNYSGFEGQLGVYSLPADPITQIGELAWVAVNHDAVTNTIGRPTLFPKNLSAEITPRCPEFVAALEAYRLTHPVSIVSHRECPMVIEGDHLQAVDPEVGYQERIPPKLTGEDLCDPCYLSHPYVVEYRARIKGDLSDFRLNGELVVVGTRTEAYLYRLSPDQGVQP